jgi:hypothetical protein
VELRVFAERVLTSFALGPVELRRSIGIPLSGIRDLAVTADGRGFAVLSTTKFVPFPNLINVSAIASSQSYRTTQRSI